MAEYILDVKSQTSKLDWAFPFQRTGAFPLDRSALFSSLADATAYAAGDGSDSRELGGSSYVGQIISVLEDSTVNAYLITNERKLLRLAATAASGDLNSDIEELQNALDELTDKIADTYTKSEADNAIAAAIAKAPHMKRKAVADVAAIEAEKDAADALEYIYMVPSGLKDEDNKYYEYIIVEESDEDSGTVRSIERVGSWEVSLKDYATLTYVNEELEKKANADTTYNKTEVDNRIAEALESATGGESAASVKAQLEAYKTSNDEKVNKNAEDIKANSDAITEINNSIADLEINAEKNFINAVSEDFTVSTERVLSLNDVAIAKVTGLQEALSSLPTTYLSIADFDTAIQPMKDDLDELKELLTWVEISTT